MSGAAVRDFEFEVPISFFEKAGAPKGTHRRHGGLISTDSEDLQGETVLQDGLDLEPFKTAGWFNDNHDRSTAAIIGYPDPSAVKTVKRGERLPDGTIAKSAGVWAEGYLLGTKRADEVWDLAQELKDSGRSLGYSVEGAVLERGGPKTVMKKGPDGSVQLVGSRVLKAVVRNVAITGCPVQPDSRLSILAKSLQALNDEAEKALSMGTPAHPGQAPVGPQTGDGAGQVVARESLEGDGQKKRKRKRGEKLTDGEAIEVVQKSVPGISLVEAARVVEVTKQLKRSGRLER